jgi:hypothetical protein
MEEGTNKKAEVIAMMKRSKGATLAEIMVATNWQNEFDRKRYEEPVLIG